MKNKYLKILLSLLPLLLCQCGSSEKNEAGQYYLKPTGKKISFSINSDVKNYTKAMEYYKTKDKEYIVYFNPPTNEILFFDIATQNLSHKIKIKKDGPDGIRNISGFQVNTLDSIYVMPLRQPILFLVNGKGKIIQRIHFEKTAKGERTTSSEMPSARYKPLAIKDGKMCIMQFSLGKGVKSPIGLEIDTATMEVKKLPMCWPSNFYEKGIVPESFSREFANGKFVYAFFYKHELYVTEDHEHVDVLESARSKYVHEIGVQDISDFNKTLKFYCEEPCYGNLVYDAYRHVYYRFVYPGIKVDKKTDMMKVIRNPSATSILILDEKFNKIGETLLPENTFQSNDFFIREDGLYLSECNVFNPDFNEDMLSFQLIELHKNDENKI